MTDDKVLEEAIRLVGEGVCVTLPVNGRSMLPFIIGGRESVILQRPGKVKVGDIVLAWVEGSRYVIHRIIEIKDNHITLMGDGNVSGMEHCAIDDIKAFATHVVDARRQTHPLYSRWRRVAAQLWFLLRPVRKYLLIIGRLL
ncbi:MAG: S24/S26 family peptidase [Prevotella sp.]|nr:S24/S26 family peptidase [Prevotella sp.]